LGDCSCRCKIYSSGNRTCRDRFRNSAAAKILLTARIFHHKKTARRITGASSGGNAGTDDVNVALKADTFLADADPEIQEQFHQPLTEFNGALFVFLFDFRFTSFVAMPPADQDSYLQSWMTSGVAFRRSAFQALKRINLSMFYTDSRTWNEIHYDGMFLPWERGG
jgi:hypothetical protein